MAFSLPKPIDATMHPGPIPLKDCHLLLSTSLSDPYLPMETGWALGSDGIYHVAAATYMPNVTGAMISWWFGYITTTEQYKLWHPRDHIYSSWEGPHGNSTYIGGHHLVHEMIGDELQKLKISFKDPSEYFGPGWEENFKEAGWETAICGRVNLWVGPGNIGLPIGHLMHIVMKTEDGVRMRSRFWLGDVPVLKSSRMRAGVVDLGLVKGLVRHASEEMAILASFLPQLYTKEMAKAEVVPVEQIS